VGTFTSSRISPNSILVDQCVYKGNIDTPKKGAGASAHTCRGSIAGDVDRSRAVAGSSTDADPQALLLPTERDTPLRRDNVWNRGMLPKLKTVGLEWATFQVLRRSNASLSRKASIDDKDAADQRRTRRDSGEG